ncbi:MAG: RbsD or FucU transport, partial [Thermoproteota archaeon]
MLLSKCIHPEILEAVGKMGHGSRILISDGCYPHITGSPASAKKVWLNLMPDMLKVTDVLEALTGIIPIEEAFVMVPPDEADQPIFADFKKLLSDMELTKLQRLEFYDKAREPDTALMIATGDQRNWA